ncbi:MAG: flagellar hook protein FlgE [Rhodosalinus sp.]|uniref:flagellar hook protein FlgE n=1 Tax=Rhodosalinus sp. TaxID=2047741 RepID=UPI00397B4D24
MTISSSLNAGIAALMAYGSRLASISDNVANASTYGYKRSQTDFQSLVLSNSGRGYAAGGVRATNVRLIDERGAVVGTDNSTDLVVRGRGFLPVAREADIAQGGQPPMLLGTTGSFRTDAEGYLRSSSGHVLMGWPANPDGSIPTFPRDTADGLQPVQINANQFFGEPTTRMSLGLNLPAGETQAGASGARQTLSVEYFDNLGASENLEFDFTPTVPGAGSSNEWTMTITDAATTTVVGEYLLTFDDSRSEGGTLDTVTTLTGGPYDPATGLLGVNVAGGPVEIDIGMPGDRDGVTQLSSAFAPLAIDKDGFPVGNMTEIAVDESGYVSAVFDTGFSRRLYQIPLADLPNPNGMISLDEQTYLPSPDSGSYFLWDAGDGPTGDIVSNALEESATDVARELTDMIRTQRAYSSSAKVIQTVDEMLQETTNLKR